MIVTDDMVQTALEYLASDPHPIAEARFNLTEAENECERRYAELYTNQNGGSIRDRETAVERNPAYLLAKGSEAEAIRDLERHKARVRWAECVIDLWRTQNANQRAAERVR